MLKAPGCNRRALKRHSGDEGVKVTRILAVTSEQAPLRNADWISAAAGRG
jgi:hypothetical protein